MLRHFAFRHPQVDLEIDGKVLERCGKCGMMSQDVKRHERLDLCRKLQERRENEKAAMKQSEADEVEFYINGERIERVREFRYLGWILYQDEKDSRCIK